MKKVAFLIIISGFIFISFGVYQLFSTNHKQSLAITEAREIINLSTLQQVETNTKARFPNDFSPDTGETVGILHIPKLEADLPIVEGTDPDELAKGVGHYKGTAYPLQKDQIVLSGHRETVFRRMGELELGDILTVRLSYGEFTYEIIDTYIVSADDRTVIKTTSPNEVLTLTTCYPFNFIGDAPDRYIITATPVTNYNK
ncbi:class D sortase [Ornithinibacillus californiensis]|uniref:class D sortase n=1 Tax=Ornithinibacillus californiensis TaxID=161536 RepID=UPI00064DCE46|nr:class D sortase [Ornithinibacillus californiensis]